MTRQFGKLRLKFIAARSNLLVDRCVHFDAKVLEARDRHRFKGHAYCSPFEIRIGEARYKKAPPSGEAKSMLACTHEVVPRRGLATPGGAVYRRSRRN